MNRTILLASGGGRLGNQLNNYASLLAFQLEYPEFEIVTLPIIPYLNDYGRPDLPLANLNIKNSFFRRVLKTLTSLSKWVRRTGLESKLNRRLSEKKLNNHLMARILHKIAVWRKDSQSLIAERSEVPNLAGQHYKQLDLADEELLNKLRDKPVSVITEYFDTPMEIVNKYEDRVREHLQPGEEHKKRVKEFIQTLKSDYDKLVGVHIRQGDYKIVRNGKYYFTSEEYIDFIKEYEKKHPDKSIAFLIASEEKQNENLFDEDNYYLGLGNKPIENYVDDLVKLSMCDTILAPPSSFSQWAAFIGETPLTLLHEDVLEEGFKKIENIKPKRSVVGRLHENNV